MMQQAEERFCRWLALCVGCVLLVTPGIAEEPAASRTGIFLVLEEAATRTDLRQPSAEEYIALYDYEFLDVESRPKEKYFLLRRAPDVPFNLAAAPERVAGRDGRTELRIELADDAAAAMERFTREHLGESAAFVVDGEVITAHKIRTVITNGAFQVSRCTDQACEYILARLSVRESAADAPGPDGRRRR